MKRKELIEFLRNKNNYLKFKILEMLLNKFELPKLPMQMSKEE
jgi:hypothetical protein